MAQHQAAAAYLVRDLHHLCRQAAVCLAGEHLPAQGIVRPRIEAGRYDDEIRFVSLQRRDDDAVIDGLISANSRTRRQRHVDVEAGAGALSRLADVARIRGETVVLVHRYGQGGRVFPERGLGAVAVMHVPVHYGDTVQLTLLQQVHAGNGRVAEYAEPHTHIGQGVVSRRPHQGVGIVHPAVKHRINRLNHTAGSQGTDLETAAPHRGEKSGLGQVLVVLRLDFPVVFRAMEPADLFFRRLPRLDMDQVLQDAADVQQVAYTPLGLLVLRVNIGLHGVSERHESRKVTVLMPHVKFVIDKACCHFGLLEFVEFREKGLSSIVIETGIIHQVCPVTTEIR